MEVQSNQMVRSLAIAISRIGLPRLSGIFCVGVAALLSVSVSAQPVITDDLPVATLPLPSGEPLKIDFSNDAFLQLMNNASPAEAFRENVGVAVEHYPAIAAAIASQAEANAVKTEVRAGYFPRVDAQLIGARSITRNLGGDKTQVERLSPSQRSDAVASVDQLLFDFGATQSRVAAAAARIKAAQADVARVAAETVLRAVTAYYDVLTFQILSELSHANIARSGQILDDSRTRFAQGVGSAADTARAEVFMADAQVQGVRFQRRLDSARGNYRELFGVDAPVHLTRPLPPVSAAQSVAEAIERSRDAPAVSAAIAQTAAARLDWRAARSDTLPRLTAGVTSSLYDLAGGANSYDVRGQLVLRKSFSFGGASSARADQARARFDRAERTTERITNENARDAQLAWGDIALLQTSATTLQAAYAANRRSRDSVVEQFRVSRGSLIDLLRAEQEYFAASANYLQGAVELDMARYILLARTGEILPVFGIVLHSQEVAR